MDIEIADQLGRELAWTIAKEAGLVDYQMAKEAGLLEGLLFAPLTAVSAMISAPFGSKMRSMGTGLLLGAGIGAVAEKEVENRNAAGDPVESKGMSPMMKSIMAGFALGGAERIKEKGLDSTSGILAGAPLGALITSKDPTTGMAVGGVSGSLLSALQGKIPTGSLPKPIQGILQVSGLSAQQPNTGQSPMRPALADPSSRAAQDLLR